MVEQFEPNWLHKHYSMIECGDHGSRSNYALQLEAKSILKGTASMEKTCQN